MTGRCRSEVVPDWPGTSGTAWRGGGTAPARGGAWWGRDRRECRHVCPGREETSVGGQSCLLLQGVPAL